MENTYSTSDYLFAAYLMYKGFFCLKAIPAEDPQFPDRKMFVFLDVDDPKELEQLFYRNRQEPLSARKLMLRIRTAQDILRTGLNQEELDKLRKERSSG